MLNMNDLHGYQEDAIDFIINHEGSMVLADIGAGKTVITLTALLECDDFPALVVAPKRVCEMVWAQQGAEWEHLQHLTFSRVLGTPGQRAKALATKADVYLINYENLGWLMSDRSPDLPQFQAIVWDEISKMKSLGSRWKATKNWARTIPVRIGLTGSPIGNSMVGVWSQAALIDTDDLLGRGITKFRKRWFYTTDYEGHNWELFPGGWAEKEITDIMSAYTYRMNPADYNQLPDLIENDIMIRLPTNAINDYNSMEKHLVLEINDDTDPDYIEAANAAVLTGKLRQLAAGCMYLADGSTTTIHNEKMRALHDLVDELNGEPLLLFYDFKYQATDILREFDQAQVLNEQSVEHWNRGDVQILLAHPASAGHGLNLQAGGHHVCFMSINWSLELYEQAIGRLRRQGQTKPVFVHRLLCDETIDLDVRASLKGDGDEQSAILKLLEKHNA